VQESVERPGPVAEAREHVLLLDGNVGAELANVLTAANEVGRVALRSAGLARRDDVGELSAFTDPQLADPRPQLERWILQAVQAHRRRSRRPPRQAQRRAALVGALRTLALERVVVTNLAGRVLDDGEVAAIVAAQAHKASLTTTLLFCDEDPVARQNMGAAIESVGIDVARD